MTNENLDLERDAQKTATQEAAFRAQIDARLKDLHTCLPGIIAKFDAATQTASVQPAIKRVFTEKGAVNLPLCVDVPVAFPGGGDFFVTFPVQAGDECLLLFSERAIDLWHAQGGTKPPAEYRLHDLSDGIAIVGLNSHPKKIANFNATAMELRNRTNSVRIRLNANGEIDIKGNVNIDGNLNITGTTIGNGVNLNTHRHSGVQTGGGNTGTPI